MSEVASIGHNSIAGKELLARIEQIERIEEERKYLAGDVKDVYTLLKSKGFDTKIVRKVVRLRKMDKAQREEEETLTDLYLQACGML